MKLRKKNQIGTAVVLAALLAVLCLIPLQAQAAGPIDTGKQDCSIRVEAAGDDYSRMQIPVSVYRVAEVSSSGTYTALAPFTDLNFGSITSRTTASEWMNLAAKAKQILDKGGSAVQASGKTTVTKGSGSITGLKTGMYLIVAESAYSADYSKRYTFTPYLSAVPNNPYASGTYGQGEDQWDYHPVVGLKAQQDSLKGKLTITKTLKNYNETLGKTTFVFEITGKDSSGKVVYSNVVSTTHSGPGSQTVTIPNLPAGITVTVKEIYSGASYTPVGKTSDDTYIYSDEAITNGAGKPAEVTFTNQYDGGNRGGYGVTNRFQSDGQNGWIWSKDTAPGQQ